MNGSHFDGRYEVIRLLGGGGMAEVYLARDEHLGRDVALKVLKERLTEDEVFLKLFRREARSAATLNHPKVVQIYDQRGSEDGRCYIAMEYVPGGTLKERITREGALDPAEAARLALQVAEALWASHARGIIHRDVKSQNVLLDAAGGVKVADFGIARAADSTTLSGPGSILGTAKYMSPEQATGSDVTPRSDLYSLGVVLYEMLTGELPFDAEDLAQALAERDAGPPPRPSDVNPGVPEAMDTLVGRLMTKDPDRRLGSAAELVDELDRMQNLQRPAAPLVPQQAPSLPAPAPRDVGPKQRRRRPIWLLATLAALLVLLGALAWGLGPETIGRGVAGAVGELAGGARGAFEGARRALLGPEEVSVPDVEGLTRSEARGRLTAAGLEAEIRSRESSEADAGKVLEQSVPGGREVEEGSRILLAVGEARPSAGTPEDTPKDTPGNSPREGTEGETVPDLVGLTYPEAEETLQAAGFIIGGVSEVPSETVPAGVIISQDPTAGSAATGGAPIVLTTSTGTTGASTSVAPSASAPASPSASP